jgi:hypothetical protein
MDISEAFVNLDKVLVKFIEINELLFIFLIPYVQILLDNFTQLTFFLLVDWNYFLTWHELLECFHDGFVELNSFMFWDIDWMQSIDNTNKFVESMCILPVEVSFGLK